MQAGGRHQSSRDSLSPPGFSDKQVIQHVDRGRGHRTESWVELSESDQFRRCVGRHENGRLLVRKPGGDESFGERQIGWLLVKLAVLIEKLGDSVKIARLRRSYDHLEGTPVSRHLRGD